MCILIVRFWRSTCGLLIRSGSYKRGEETATITFEKYLPNEPIPASTFEMPE